MSNIDRSALVYYSPDEMYQLVNDVGSYESFLPWCRSSHVISESDEMMEASVEIAKGILNKTFTTRNHLTPGKKIEMELIDGPFKNLSGHWQFDPLKKENTCKISLQLQFEFSNSLASLAIKPVFTQIANSLVDAFIQRAIEVYGERG